MQTHLAPRTLKGTEKPEKDVQVLFAVQSNRKAILFIHGFSGDAIKTWSDFHKLLPSTTECSGCDLIFYGYDGLRAQMNSSAAIFRVFLDRLFNSTETFLSDNLPPSALRANNFEYDELIIVAHSLGAVITRRALIDATLNQSIWVTKTKMILYAPAHKGAKVVDLALETISSFIPLKYFTTLVRFNSPLIDELKPESRALCNLLNDTEKARIGNANPHLRAIKVVIAERDNIVENERFADDPPAYAIPDTTHTSICKPSTNFLAPLSHLVECL